MKGTMIDSSVLIDVLGGGAWEQWSSDALLLASSRGPLVINPLVYSEVSVGYDDIAALDIVLPEDSIERRQVPWLAAFLAGKAFQQYRRRGGTRTSPLPDFYIGAHAAVEGLDVLTRDPRRFLSYFRGITVISPEG